MAAPQALRTVHPGYRPDYAVCMWNSRSPLGVQQHAHWLFTSFHISSFKCTHKEITCQAVPYCELPQGSQQLLATTPNMLGATLGDVFSTCRGVAEPIPYLVWVGRLDWYFREEIRPSTALLPSLNQGRAAKGKRGGKGGKVLLFLLGAVHGTP